MSEKIEIGGREYELPFTHFESTIRNEVRDSGGRIIADVYWSGEVGKYIADALNHYARSVAKPEADDTPFLGREKTIFG